MADITGGQLISIRAKCLKCAIKSIYSTQKYDTNAVLIKADEYFQWVMEPLADDT